MTTAPAPPPRRIEYMVVADLQPAPRNPKLHDDAGISTSIDQFGYVDPMIVDERTGRLVSGHGRQTNLAELETTGKQPPEGIIVDDEGRWLAPVVRGWSSRDDDQAAAYVIATNRLTESGGWERVELTEILGALADVDMLDVTGFHDDDLAAMLDDLANREPDPEPDPEPDVDDLEPPAAPVTKAGDVWLLGPHRIMCGSSRIANDVERLVAGATINLAMTSPPYADRRVYDETTEFRPIPPDEYVEWFAPVASLVGAHLADDGSWVVNIKPGVTPDGDSTELYVLDLVLAHAREWGWNLATEFCWERSGVPKQPARRLKNQFEPIYQFARGRWKFRPENVMHWSDNVPVAGGPGSGDTSWHRDQGTTTGVSDSFGGSKKRKRKNGAKGPLSEWQGENAAPGEYITEGMAYPGNRLPTLSGSHEATGHAAAYPVGLPAWFVKLMTDVGDVVYDPFMGSGSTLLAAHQNDRVALGMEISPRYVDVICRRWQRHTGIVPILEATGAAQDFSG